MAVSSATGMRSSATGNSPSLRKDNELPQRNAPTTARDTTAKPPARRYKVASPWRLVGWYGVASGHESMVRYYSIFFLL